MEIKIRDERNQSNPISFNNLFFQTSQRTKFQQIRLRQTSSSRLKPNLISSTTRKFINSQNIKERQQKNIISNLNKLKAQDNAIMMSNKINSETYLKETRQLKTIDLRQAYQNYRKRSSTKCFIFSVNNYDAKIDKLQKKQDKVRITKIELDQSEEINKKNSEQKRSIQLLMKQKQKFKEKCINLLYKNTKPKTVIPQFQSKNYQNLIQQFKAPQVKPINIQVIKPLSKQSIRQHLKQIYKQNYSSKQYIKQKQQTPCIRQIQETQPYTQNQLQQNPLMSILTSGQQLKQIKRIQELFEKQQYIKIMSYKSGINERKHISYSKSARVVSAPKNLLKHKSNYQSTSASSNTQGLVSEVSSSYQNQKKKLVSKMIFRLNEFGSDKVYKKKIEAYLDFIFKINFSNNIYVDLNLKSQSESYQKYKVYIGKGNNSLLIKGLIKRRFWFEIVSSHAQDINFYWTQLKQKDIHQKQNQFKSKQIAESPTKLKELKNLNNKKLKNQQNLKIMNKNDAIYVDNFPIFNLKYPLGQKYKSTIVTNHIPQNSYIGSKKALFHSLYYYYKNCLNLNPFWYIPLTFHVKGPDDQSFKQFCKASKGDINKVWIIKPGQNSNRGNGISLAYTKQIYSKIHKKQYHQNGEPKTYIIQSYINKPFLYNHRKFDIRHYMMITCVNGIMKAFWYQEGYIRTSSYKYDLDQLQDNLVHLTNDAVQKYGEDYGKYEAGNKLSYSQFQRYLDMHYPAKKYNFQTQILPKMKNIALDAIKANFRNIDKKRRQNNFQVFGLDFMIDHKFKPWLIQINSNPCLQISCPLLSRLIPGMIQNALRIGLDPLFPPPTHYPVINRYDLSDNILSNLKFQLIFDEKTDKQELLVLFKNALQPQPQMYELSDNQQQYEDDGQQMQIKI